MPEQTYLVFHPTHLAYLKWYLIALAFIVVGTVLILSAFKIISIGLTIPSDLSLYTIAIPFMGAVFIVVATFIRRDDTYAITNYRVLEKKGILNIKEDSVNWEKVSNYTLTQSAIERLFNIGTLRLYSVGGAGDMNAEITIKRAPNIHKIKALLDKLIEKKGPVV